MNRRAASRNELDAVTVNIELTLSSIIQGVALSFLADNARDVLRPDHATAWPYVIAGLLIVLLFWSRSLIHTLTLIRWPLEFGHNCLYIACALVEVLAFTRLTRPFSWFALLALFSASVWVIFVYDMKIIRERLNESTSKNSRTLYSLVVRDQLLNIRFIIPAIFFLNLGAALALRARPDFFLAHHGHLIFISIETVGLLLYLGYVIRSFTKITPLVAATREDWRSDEETPTSN